MNRSRSPSSTDLPLADGLEPPRIAVIGAGVAGAACAAGLLRAGFDVAVFDKSRGVGGRLATRRAQWAADDGSTVSAAFDHGCPHFSVTRPRFASVVDRALALGAALRWRPRVFAAFPAAQLRDVVVPTPGMPVFCRHLLNGVPLRLGRAVTGLQRSPGGWMLRFADAPAEGPFEQVVLAIPAAQAAPLLRGHHDDWAEALGAVEMAPCWTLMAATDDVDWPWDAAQPERGDLAWIVRNDRVPERSAGGLATWVAHATPAWSSAHLEADAAEVTEHLRAALGRALTGGTAPRWHHASVHRWRYAQRVAPTPGLADRWLDTILRLGLCGDALADGSVEGAWCSGDDLASALIASLGALHRPLSDQPTGDAPWQPIDAHS